MAAGNFIIILLRPDDLLSLQFQFVNLSLDTAQSPPSLVRTQADQPAFVLVGFGPLAYL
jgi:hypothetical protein